MSSVSQHLIKNGPVARRCDLLAAGFTDHHLRRALSAGQIFRVRHGWYARAGTADAVARAVRVGGIVTGVEALRLRGLFLERPDRIDIAVPRNAAALRSPERMRQRLTGGHPIRVHWITAPRNQRRSADWLASEDDALLLILRIASREVAVAACDGLVRYRRWTALRLDAAFARAPARVRPWRRLVDGRADSWGESFLRLRLQDAGLAFEPQAEVPGVGRFDGRLSPGVYVEVDGAQHDESWAGSEPSSFERDHAKDLGLALVGARCIRITYALFAQRWDDCLTAMRRAVADDGGGGGRGNATPRRPRKLRTIAPAASQHRQWHGEQRRNPEFSHHDGTATASRPAASGHGRSRAPYG
ncbi:hypothetical protein BH09ACT4_BH09ACT4_01330 [soil metagenome]